MRTLLLGAGNNSVKQVAMDGDTTFTGELVRLDIDVDCAPDVVWDLNIRPLPFKDEEFDEIHAYEVLEHVGTQGNWKGFFEEFSEYARILKPGGFIVGTVPLWSGQWAWGDPGHTRVLTQGTFAFLSQAQYEAQVGKTNMTDYRSVWKHDFQPVAIQVHGDKLIFVLKKVA